MLVGGPMSHWRTNAGCPVNAVALAARISPSNAAAAARMASRRMRPVARLVSLVPGKSAPLSLLVGFLAQPAGHPGGRGPHRVEGLRVLLVAADVAAEGSVHQLEGELLRRGVREPDDEGGGEELAQPDLVLALAGEDLVLLLERLRLELHPLLLAAELVLELLQRPEAEL